MKNKQFKMRFDLEKGDIVRLKKPFVDHDEEKEYCYGIIVDILGFDNVAVHLYDEKGQLFMYKNRKFPTPAGVDLNIKLDKLELFWRHNDTWDCVGTYVKGKAMHKSRFGEEAIELGKIIGSS